MYALRHMLLYVLLLLVGLTAVVWLFSDIVIYFGVALVLTTLMKPLVNMLHRFQVLNYRMHRSAAILIAFLVATGLLWVIFWLFLPLITGQAQVVASLDYHSLLQHMAGPIEKIEQFLINLQVTDSQPGFLSQALKKILLTFFKNIEVGSVLNYFLELTGGVFVMLLSVIFITFVLLYEEQVLYRSFIAFVPNRYFEMVLTWVFKIEKRFVSYLGGLSIQIGIIFTLVAAGLFIAGVKYAATIALFAALANLVPYLGPLLGAVFAIIVGVSATETEVFSYATLALLIKIGIVFLIVQLTDNLLIQPLVFSRSVQAHPIEIFLIIFVGATLAGIGGMVVAIPVYTILKVSFAEGYKGLSAYRIFKA